MAEVNECTHRVIIEPLNTVDMNESNDLVISPRNVLSYWFDGSLQENYKSKWFPTGDQQEIADRVVYSRYNGLLVLALENKLASLWNLPPIHEMIELDKGYIALIIVLDQFSRHIYRYQGLPSDSTNRILADSLALELSESISMYVPNWSIHLTIPEHVFCLMPFRHSATISRYQNHFFNDQYYPDRLTDK